VTDVTLLEGINDLGQPPYPPADGVIDGLRRAARRLRALRPRHRRPRLNVLLGTLTPSGGTRLLNYGSAEINGKRGAINRWIRTSGIGDGVVDFDRALRDPSHPSRLVPRYDSGDHLHPSSAGYRRMARGVNLALLRGPQCTARRASGSPRFTG
jgi:lysophospholipase L1-like esterase